MIGMIVKICREVLSVEDFLSTFENKRYDTPIAPAEGLYLYRIDYSKYNTKKKDKKNNIELNEDDVKSIDEFSLVLREKVADDEIENLTFRKWILNLEGNKNED